MADTTLTEKSEVTQDEASVLGMSDEDFLNEESQVVVTDDTETETRRNTTDVDDTEETETDAENEQEEDETEEDEEGEETETSDTSTDSDTGDIGNVDTEKEATTDDDENEDQETSDDEDEETEDTTSDAEETESIVDYKAEYEKVMAPFKANGTTLQVKNTDEIITLMQMGANYNKKMAGLKPSLKIVKLLEKNNLLDSEKLNYMIDLYNKKPEAITKLVKDSKIDPMDIDVSTETSYKPEDRQVTDTEIALDTVLESIKDTPTYNQTLSILTEQWDEASRAVIGQNPHIIELINNHVADGTYEAINQVVQREKSLGKLNNFSDIDAYKVIGDYLQQEGQLPNQKVPTKKIVKTAPKPKPKQEAKRTKMKKAVSATKHVKDTPKQDDFNPLAMSDEEFTKLASKEYGIR